MAGVQGAAAIAAAATISSPFPPANGAAPIPGKSLVLVSSLSSPFPSRRTRRTNHLRQKILKTLENKPYLDTSLHELPSKTPMISVEETLKHQHDEVGQFSVSETPGFVDGVVGKFSTKSFVKIGLYLVGAFIFQTVISVLIFGSNDLEGEDGSLNSDDYKKTRVSDLGVNRNNEWRLKSDSLLSGNRNLMETKEGGMVSVDESEMDKRIVEIQEMARDARQREKLEAKKKGLVEEGNDDDADYNSIDKTMKEKEVDGRLMKLQKNLESSYQKLPRMFPRKEGDVDKGIPAAEEAFGPLMFKKKYKFKSPSVGSGDKPKGFDGTEDRYVANGTLINGITSDKGTLQTDKSNDDGTLSNGISSDNGVDTSESGERIDLPNGNDLEGSVTTNQDNNKGQEPIDDSMPTSEPRNELVKQSERAKPRVIKTESVAGTSKEPEYDKQAVGAAKPGKSSDMEGRKPRGFGKGSQSDTAISTKQDYNNRNGSLNGKKGGKRKSARNLGDMKSSTQTDFWWTSLPYVLAVLMQRGGDVEGSEGLFTLRGSSQTKSGLYHTVAFEDRGDATNFCYLLESFFEDLGDFMTDIIPIPTNELEEAMKSQIMKVVVVKKGQLKMYVGQPLADVETALRTLIEQSEKL